MEIKQLQYFLCIQETGSFSSAAEDLYISQSSLSKQIMALEKELGFTLFDRTKRKIRLTEAGESFHKHAMKINEAYKAMLAELADYTTTPSLNIVAIPVIAQYGIPAYIAQFKNTHPHVSIALEEREAVEILPALNSEQYDLAVLRDNYLDTDNYAAIEISKDKLIVLVSTQHRYATRKSIGLADLADENFIMFDRGTVVHELAMDACKAAGFQPRIFYASLRVESIISLVGSNMGVALMMERISNYHQRPDVVALLLNEQIASNIVIAYLKGKKLSKPARLFIEFIERRAAVAPQSDRDNSDACGQVKSPGGVSP